MNKKMKNALIIIYVFAFLISCFGAAMAYFTVMQTKVESAETDIGSATMTSIIFNAGEPISLYASQYNFGEGMEDLSGETYASSTLKIGSVEESATFFYNVSIEFANNDLTYTTPSKTPEILLTIKDPKGEEIKEINGLNYTTVNGKSGFDITGKEGDFNIANNYEITTTNEITQKWDVKITFVNLKESQDANKGHGLSGRLKIDPIY